MKVARKLGVTDSEIDKLSEAILKALKGGPLDPDGIRKNTGEYSRSLGPDGQKKGVSTTLPLALGQLQVSGRIRRISTNGRLDQQRYQYTLWPGNPLAKCKWTKEEAYSELARRYFRWIGPATLSEFQWFSGLGVKAAKAAVEPLGLVAVDETRLLPPDALDDLRSFKPIKKQEFKLVASIDSMVLLRRKHADLLAPEDINREILGDKGKKLGMNLPDNPMQDTWLTSRREDVLGGTRNLLGSTANFLWHPQGTTTESNTVKLRQEQFARAWAAETMRR